jgi:hypothetical protein
MAQDNASQHKVRTGNGSPLFYQSEDASIILGRQKTKPHAIAVYQNSASLPIPILGERRIYWTSKFFDLTGNADIAIVAILRHADVYLAIFFLTPS